MREKERGCIAAGHPRTAEAGQMILEAGGNAFDAAIAALWMACVAEPVLASIGGSGFCLIRDREGSSLLYDFFAQTPRHRRARQEVDFQPVDADFGVATQSFHIGVGSATTPGMVRGIFAIHRAHGSMPMRELVAPAIVAAREGVIQNAYQAYLLRVIGPIYRHTAEARNLFTVTDGERMGELWRAGDRIVNPALADTLDVLSREGDRLFYEGEIAAAIDRLSVESGGHLRRVDLSEYQAIVRKPLRFQYRGAQILSNPPPASGGLLVAFALALLSGRRVGELSIESSVRARLLTAVMAATRDARARHGVAVALLGPELLARYAGELGAPPSTRGTTHISVVDNEGDAAAITVSNGEGCGSIMPGTGSMLNNMLGEEDINPGGGEGWPVDMRMASMMAPTVFATDEGRLAVLGSGGSKRIMTAILQVLVNLLDHRMSLAEAIGAPRIHLEGEHLNWEPGLDPAAAAALAEDYPEHTAWPERNMYFGGVHAVIRGGDGRLHGVGDPRRAGVSLGGDRD